MAEVTLKDEDREVWLRCFAGAITGLLSSHQALTYEPDQLIRQAGKLADMAVSRAQGRRPEGADGRAASPAHQLTPPPMPIPMLHKPPVPSPTVREKPPEAPEPHEPAQPHNRVPAFPFYASDFLASTGLMSNAAVGAFIRMLAHVWTNGPVPNTPVALARAMNHSVGDPPFESLWAEVQPKWFHTRRGWINCRLELVRWERASFIEKQLSKEKLSAAAQAAAAPARVPAASQRRD
jgi:uncharacterized protein YdaU (DUF1376 family)